jgi:hypothetical protein
MLCLLALTVLSGCQPQARPTPPPPSAAPTPTFSPEQSWKAFVADTRAECETNPTCTLDYDTMHEYDGRYYGVTVIGYKESECYFDLYRFDPRADKWIGGPRTMTEVGIEDIDYPATSKQWNVPEATIKMWLDDAKKTAREVYSQQQ